MINRKLEDLVGKVFGRLEVIRFHGIKSGKTYWWCRCSCGNEKPMRADAMKSGVVSCGCLKVEMSRQFEDLSGKIFSRVTVIKISKRRGPAGEILWCCRCLCGTQFISRGSSLRSGHTKSCGCLHSDKAKQQAIVIGKANKTHGMVHTREYEAWHHMRQRCLDCNQPGYSCYGGRGITICERWDNFENFFADMDKRPSSKHSVGRIDNNGNYEPSNCRWEIQKQQQRNRRSNILIEYGGKVQCISAWAEEYKMTTLQLWARIRKMGWSVHDALTVPIAKTTQEKKFYNKKYRNKI